MEANWSDLHMMELGSALYLDDTEWLRVPGGWIVTLRVPATKTGWDREKGKTVVLGTYQLSLPPVFVPYNEEFSAKRPTPPPTAERAPKVTERPPEDRDDLPF